MCDRDSFMFSFRGASDKRRLVKKFQIDEGATWDQLCMEFHEFLKGLGYQFDLYDRLTVVDGDGLEKNIIDPNQIYLDHMGLDEDEGYYVDRDPDITFTAGGLTVADALARGQKDKDAE